VCLCVVCVRCPPTHSFCLRWQIILEIKTTDADKCAVRLLQPFVFAHALYAWGCFVPVCGCFHRLSISLHASPSTHSVVLSGQFATLASYGAQPCVVCDPLIYRVLACEFRVAVNEQFDMTAVCKFQYLFGLLSRLISCL